LLTSYNAGYAAAMARAHRDLERLNTELVGELAKVKEELRELQAVVLARHGVVQELTGLYRERQIMLARAAERDQTRPLQ
jgi:hypothetical protein